jgi:hypothetical protein
MSADPGAAAASLHQLPDGVAQRASALPGHAPRRAAGRARVRQQHPSQRRTRADSGPRLATGANAPRWPPESWKRAQESVALRHGGAMIEAGLMILRSDGGGPATCVASSVPCPRSRHSKKDMHCVQKRKGRHSRASEQTNETTKPHFIPRASDRGAAAAKPRGEKERWPCEYNVCVCERVRVSGERGVYARASGRAGPPARNRPCPGRARRGTSAGGAGHGAAARGGARAPRPRPRGPSCPPRRAVARA